MSLVVFGGLHIAITILEFPKAVVDLGGALGAESPPSVQPQGIQRLYVLIKSCSNYTLQDITTHTF